MKRKRRSATEPPGTHTHTHTHTEAVREQVLQALAPIHAADMVHGSVDASAVFICSSGCVRLGNLVHSQHADSAECRGV